ncbi:MAG: HAD family hydrolase [Candidatus Aenigmarchaeota archaeon]|nr:HAD family hydrolase [Candidatus Aenigmarchaeota archaeon]
MMDAVIFDLFGTLMYIRKETHFHHRLFIELGLAEQEVRVARRVCLTENLPDIASLLKRLLQNKRVDTSTYEVELFHEVESCTLYPETLEVLDRLRQRGMKLGLASNLATPYKELFYRLGLSEFIPRPTFSCDEGVLKPEREIYERALRRVGAQPQNTLMVGDKFGNDVRGPLSVGMNALLLDRSGLSNYFARIKTLKELLVLVQ